MTAPSPLDDALALVLEARDRGEDVDVDVLASEAGVDADEIRAFLDADAVVADAAAAITGGFAEEDRPIAPPEVEGFTVLGEIARGGAGVVFEAEQHEPRRRVALKTLRDSVLASEEDVERFRREAQAAAELDHPGIVRILEVGATDGRIWFTMPLAAGGSLSDRLDELVGKPRASARLVLDVARAVAHGHARGILHRDLKPGNVLLDQRGNPLVADFGLARRLEPVAGNRTTTGTVLGTPTYMPPEQALGDLRAIDERSDVWSLGAILHELLTGRPPFLGAHPIDTLRQVVEADLVPVRTRTPTAPKPLATICERCLEKDPGDRYASMRDVADELDRFLRGETIRARPRGPLSRIGGWVRRHRTAVALTALGVVSAAAVWLAVTSTHQREEQTRISRARELLATAHRLSAAGDVPGAAAHFAAADSLDSTWASQRGLLAHARPVPLALYATPPHTLWRVRWSRDGTRLAAGSANGNVYVWSGDPRRPRDLEQRTLPHTPSVHVRGLAFGGDGRLATGDEAGHLRLFDPATGALDGQLVPETGIGAVLAMTWVSGGRVAVGTTSGRVVLWSPTSQTLEDLVMPTTVRDVRAVATCDDGDKLLVGFTSDHETAGVLLVDLATGTHTLVGPAHEVAVWDADWNDAHGLLATADNKRVRLLRASDFAVHAEMPHDAPVGALALSPNGQLVVSATTHGDVRAFSTETGRQVGPTLRHRAQVFGIAIAPREDMIATVGLEGRLRIWQTPRGTPYAAFLRPSPTPARSEIVVAPGTEADAALALDVAEDGMQVTLLQRQSREPVASGWLPIAEDQTPLHVRCISSGPQRWRVITHFRRAEDRGARVAFQALRVNGSRIVVEDEADHSMRGTPTMLAVGTAVQTTSAATSEHVQLFNGSVADPRRNIEGTWRTWLSSNGTWLVRSPSLDPRTLLLERAATGADAAEHVLTGDVAQVAISDDGELLAIILTDDRRVLVYDTRTRRIRATIQQGDVYQLAFAAGGRALLTRPATGPIRLWNTRTGAPVGRPLDVKPSAGVPGIRSFALAPDAARLHAVTASGSIVSFDLSWLERKVAPEAWPRIRLAAQLGAMARVQSDGEVVPMDVATWRRLRATLAP